MSEIPIDLVRYHRAGSALVCALDVQPWRCDFWPIDQFESLNEAYAVSKFAPGYVGFASSGGGELFAWSPTGSIVCLPFVGMSPTEELPIAQSWGLFESMLRRAT